MRYEEEKLKNDFEKPKFDQYTNYPTERERGGCLTVFLVFIMAVNAFFVFALCATYSAASQSREAASLMPLMALAVGVECAVIACAAAIWNWKRWGYYGLMAAYALNIVISLFTGNMLNTVSAIGGLAILVWLVNDKLDQFD